MKINVIIEEQVDASGETGLPGPLASIAERRARSIGMGVEEWLSLSRKINDEFHAGPGFSSVVRKAVSVISEAVENGGKMVIFSDYDVDGCTSSAIMALALSHIGARYKQVPSARHTDGYGFSKGPAGQISHGDSDVIIVLDCGTVDYDAVAMCCDAGKHVIIVDHHLPADDFKDRHSPAAVYVNPKLYSEEDAGDSWNMCTAGLASWIALSLVDISDGTDKSVSCAEAIMGLAALGTVADMARLDRVNRSIVKAGIAAINGKSVKKILPGLAHLWSLFKIKDGSVTPQHLGWSIGPALNSPGRLGSAFESIATLTPGPVPDRRESAIECFTVNKERKDATKESMSQALRLVAEMDTSTCIVVGDPTWNSGIVGLLASRLQHKYHVPTFVYGSGERGSSLLKGSCRGPDWCDVHHLMNKCGKFLARKGGHKAAGGFSIHPDMVGEFRVALAKAINDDGGPVAHNLVIDAEVDPFAIKRSWGEYLNRISPFGPGSPEPVFISRGLLLDEKLRYGAEGAHTRLSAISMNDTLERRVYFTWWRRSVETVPLVPGRKFDAVYRVSVDDWKGSTDIRLVLEHVIDEYGKVY